MASFVTSCSTENYSSAWRKFVGLLIAGGLITTTIDSIVR